ncbi:hypothetical protein C0J50_21498, partial [Silurus asotus]
VYQNPTDLFKKTKESANISCSHSIANHQVMLWYKRSDKNQLQLLGYLNVKFPYPEDSLKSKVELLGDGSSKGNLAIKDLQPDDNSVYFCAVRLDTVLQNSVICDKNLSPSQQHTFSTCSCTTSLVTEIKPHYTIVSAEHKINSRQSSEQNRVLLTGTISTGTTFSQNERLNILKILILNLKLFLSNIGSLFSNDVYQKPADVLCLPDASVVLTCNHSISSYNIILWYYRTHGDTSLKLIGYVYVNPKYEENYEGNFTLSGDGRHATKDVFLFISHLTPEDNAVYFCAARKHSHTSSLSVEQKVYTKHLHIRSILFWRASCSTIQQIPAGSLLAKEKDSITIQCSHDDNSLLLMLWYQQKSDSTNFSLISYIYGSGKPNNEDEFKDRFHMTKESTLKGKLTISKVLQSDSAVYYCAAS